MRILYIVQSTMVTLEYGGEQRNFFMLHALEKIAQVDVLAVVAKIPDVNTWKLKNVEYVVDPRFRKNRLSFWFHLLLRKTKFLPNFCLPSIVWADRVLSRKFKQNHYDCVVTRYCPMASRFRPWRYAPTVIDTDDLPTEVYSTLTAKQLPHWLANFGMAITSKWFSWLSNNASLCLIANRDHLARFPKQNACYVRNIARPVPGNYQVDCPPKPKLIMVGSFGHYPNAEGARRFVNERWPKIHEVFPSLELHIIGGNVTSGDLKLFSSTKGVVYRGYVEDLDAEYQDALASVADIYSGSGTCIKVVESVYHKRCCLVSDFASRGAPQDWFDNGWLLPIDNAVDVIGQLLSVAPKRIRFPEEVPGFTQVDFNRDVVEAIRRIAS